MPGGINLFFKVFRFIFSNLDLDFQTFLAFFRVLAFRGFRGFRAI